MFVIKDCHKNRTNYFGKAKETVGVMSLCQVSSAICHVSLAKYINKSVKPYKHDIISVL